MPWTETDAMDQRCKFVMAYSSGQFEMAELCRLYAVSRPTGYKWVGRHREQGVLGLQPRSRAPRHCPHRMKEQAERWLLAERRAHPHWGPRKLLRRYQTAHSQAGPSRSAIADLLRRHGLSQPQRRRRVDQRGGRRVVAVQAPNELWTIDFKGHFRMGDHRWCYPLTVMDSASRYLLACQGELRIQGEQVQRRMRELFECYGLPNAIHSDNGAPFAGTGSTGLSRLSVSWLKLGIELHRSRPGCPQDNGAHERMHRTLKAETARPAAANLRAQRRRFHHFRREYNQQRPHEALSDRTPSELYRCSTRAYPQRLERPHYPGHFQVRRVRTDGSIKWLGRFLFVSSALCGEFIALEEIEEGIWSLWFMAHLLGRIDVRTMKITYVPV
jgi:transposase InsO family protein